MDREALLTLYLLLDQHPLATRELLAPAGDPGEALALLRRGPLPTLTPALRERVQRWRAGELQREIAEGLARSLDWLAVPGRGLWCAGTDWPPAFASVEPPPLLFWQGREEVLGLPQLAIVGSRAATRQGLALAGEFASAFARAGLVVTSGLASGIDGAAHRGALAASGTTLAVMGCGLERVYPAQHRDLAEAIVAHDGLLVSEFVPGTAPLQGHFPRRNRVIAALALGVLVVEAGPDSGSISTAKAANQMSREVWALPGSVHSLASRGCHQLIRRRVAELVETPADALQDAVPALRRHYRDWALATPATLTRAPRAAADADGQALLAALGWSVAPLEVLIEALRWSPGEVLACLGELEVAGWVASVPGGYQQLPA